MLFDKIISSFNQFKDLPAFCINGEFYTYKDVHQRITAIANQLPENPGSISRLGVVCHDDIWTYAALFAAWFRGYAYVPISPKNPHERNRKIITEAGLQLVLSSKETDDIGVENEQLIITSAIELTDELCNEAFAHTNNTEVYVLFTSGSTGVPKGVPISFGNLLAFCDSMEALPVEIKQGDRCLQMFDLTFDVSVASYLLPVLKGACVFTVPPDVVKYLQIIRLMKQYQLTVITIVPSIITLLRPYLKDLCFAEVKYCILTAEASYADAVASWQPCVPEAAIWNLYGPTEATIWCTAFKFEQHKVKEYNGMFAIGRSLKNVKALICDLDGKEVQRNNKGELLIAGEQITPGYLNNEERNRDAFIEKETGTSSYRFYKTGDYCYMDEDGDIFYCGRLDNQVQVQGFRVELSEIEIIVRNGFALNNVVIPLENKFGNIELMLVVEGGNESLKDELAQHLKSQLAHYMLPASIFFMKEFPLNQSGKIDRKAIKSAIA